MREILRWHERNGGRDQLAALARALPPDLRALVDPDAEALGILPSQWYPSTLAHAVLEGVFGALPRDKRAEKMRDAAHAAIRATARGVYKMVLEKLVTPELMSAGIQRLWGLMHDDGARSFVLTGERSIESRTFGWTGHGPAPHLCELMTETSAAVLETMGKPGVTVERVACVAHGDRECLTRYTWTEGRPKSVFPPG